MKQNSLKIIKMPSIFIKHIIWYLEYTLIITVMWEYPQRIMLRGSSGLDPALTSWAASKEMSGSSLMRPLIFWNPIRHCVERYIWDVSSLTWSPTLKQALVTSTRSTYLQTNGILLMIYFRCFLCCMMMIKHFCFTNNLKSLL